jgi:RHS repeat-associated protein
VNNREPWRISTKKGLDSGATTYTYDAAGNRVSKTDGRGITVYYEYDARNRLIKVDYPTDVDVLYAYDACTNGKGRVCQVQDDTGTTNYSYGPKGEPLQEEQLILGVNYIVSYGYDENGNLLSITYPSGRTVTYSYDLADQASSVFTTPSGGGQQTLASGIAHKPFGGVSALSYGNGLQRSVAYDLQYRISGIQTGSVQDVTYSQDYNGNITAIADNLDPLQDKTFTYDTLDRLDGASGPWGNLSWTYDDVGNRLSYTDGSGTTNYTYQSGSNRLLSLTGASSIAFAYDSRGNRISDGPRQHTYNDDSRLIRLDDGIVVGDYAYNARGQRVIKTVQGPTTVFIYTQSGSLLTESDGIDFVEYAYLNGEPLAKLEQANVLYIHTDHLSTPVMMTNGSATSTWEMESRPFGYDTVISGSDSLSFRFPGQWADEESGPALGLNYNAHRWYDTRIGRYTTPDPIGTAGGDLSLYSYAASNTLRFVDPLGLKVRFHETCIMLYAGTDRLARIKQAAENADAGGQACLDCPEKEKYKDVIRNDVEFYCAPQPQGFPGICAWAGTWRGQDGSGLDGRITLFPNGVNEVQPYCPCLERVVMEEVLHYVRGGHPEGSGPFPEPAQCFKSCGGSR